MLKEFDIMYKNERGEWVEGGRVFAKSQQEALNMARQKYGNTDFDIVELPNTTKEG